MLKMPKRKIVITYDGKAKYPEYIGWNECLDEVLRLNADYEKDVAKLVIALKSSNVCLMVIKDSFPEYNLKTLYKQLSDNETALQSFREEK